jgi:hypothetical protein
LGIERDEKRDPLAWRTEWKEKGKESFFAYPPRLSWTREFVREAERGDLIFLWILAISGRTGEKGSQETFSQREMELDFRRESPSTHVEASDGPRRGQCRACRRIVRNAGESGEGMGGGYPCATQPIGIETTLSLSKG